jgi:acetyl-CoA carboxylase carboxyl transferase subunit alpha
MPKVYLEFEKPLQELEQRIEELRRLTNGQGPDIELRQLEERARKLRRQIFSNLTPWQKTLIARHPDRPYTMDYIKLITDDFIELHGDRRFSEDPSVVGGIGSIDGMTVFIIGHQKGRGTRERIERNFGQPHPEGYRKALRLMKMAERFRKPVLTLIDTPGAYPGIGAEERGQAEAIATNLMEMSMLRVPIISVVIGEGGSGGALALSVADRLYMLYYSIYSVISPEGCAAILWKKDGEVTTVEFAKAAETLKLTADDLKGFEIIDDIIPEPEGGAHRDPETTARNIKEKVMESFEELSRLPTEELLQKRYEKLRKIGKFRIGQKQ